MTADETAGNGAVITLDDIQRRLISYDPVLLPQDERTPASVALILREETSGLEILFVERAAHDADPWSGDLGFPGGKVEETDADPQAAAERETAEEVGIHLHLGKARCLGRLSDIAGVRLPIRVSCFVYGIRGLVSLRIGEEIRDAFWVPFDYLVDPQSRMMATFHFRGEAMECPAIRLPMLDKPVLWGLSYRLIMEFLQILGRER